MYQDVLTEEIPSVGKNRLDRIFSWVLKFGPSILYQMVSLHTKNYQIWSNGLAARAI